jgi:hypothetical protein
LNAACQVQVQELSAPDSGRDSVATEEFPKPANLTRKKTRRREIWLKMAKMTSFWPFLGRF